MVRRDPSAPHRSTCPHRPCVRVGGASPGSPHPAARFQVPHHRDNHRDNGAAAGASVGIRSFPMTTPSRRLNPNAYHSSTSQRVMSCPPKSVMTFGSPAPSDLPPRSLARVRRSTRNATSLRAIARPTFSNQRSRISSLKGSAPCGSRALRPMQPTTHLTPHSP